MGYRKGYYKKDGTYVQGHFANTRSRSFTKKNSGCILIFLLSLLIGSVISCSESSDTSNGSSNTSNSNCPTKTCGDFSSQAAAQSTYNNNKKCYKNLDSDGDGIACENLGK
ncbi:excalibur calcium-binding domain-containing protein [Flavobacterium saccharophilum]|uniref:Excalibur calcium-binding domain-containing protein n=1 Tax=Flavobacterium saccharophilum TaxID=29534 RepID=A0A1M7GD10_9FLAO|nr:excalibur calcium-binding domain-containing protein [Flavobacterium saccharophilum]SHM14111.1 Excalibur calcium-binding domain-containing protein [Flavobacterium saccharophilum]